MSYNYNKYKGFTLIELIVTLLIMGILLAYAIPSYNEFGMRQKVSNEANDLLGDLIFARTTAIKLGQNVTVRSNSVNDWSDGWDIFLNSTARTIRMKQAINNGLDLTGDVAMIRYTNIGTASSVGTIVISHTDTSKTVTLSVSPSGSTAIR